MSERRWRMWVAVQLDKTSESITYHALDTYEKGAFYCIRYVGRDGRELVDKFPLSTIWRIRESYTTFATQDRQASTAPQHPTHHQQHQDPTITHPAS